MHACTGTNTANLSEPIACMNRSIASTLPRTWQDINNSLDPTAASNWQLSSIKRYTLESRPPLHPPLQSQPSSFHWMKLTAKLHLLPTARFWSVLMPIHSDGWLVSGLLLFYNMSSKYWAVASGEKNTACFGPWNRTSVASAIWAQNRRNRPKPHSNTPRYGYSRLDSIPNRAI